MMTALLVSVGRRKTSIEEVRRIVASTTRVPLPPPQLVAASGLYLFDVKYPDMNSLPPLNSVREPDGTDEGVSRTG